MVERTAFEEKADLPTGSLLVHKAPEKNPPSADFRPSVVNANLILIFEKWFPNWGG